MQKARGLEKIALLLSLITGCQRSDEFTTAINKHRNTLVDQVNPVQKGLPYFTIETLNPVWALTDKTPIVTIPKFSLTDQDGQGRDESMFAGKVSVVGFIFASCSGFCPFLVEGMKNVERGVRGLSDQVQFVAFTVNPEEDTPERLKAYSVQRGIDNGKSWVLLTGNKDTIYSLAKTTFASQAFRRPNASNSFVHSEHLYVIDGEKNLRSILNGTRVDLQRDARTVISQLVPTHPQ